MTADPLIRNFSIIAHIDHGKSTLADRLIEMTGALTRREMREQVLDSMEIERERGITIKAQAVRLWHEKDGRRYQLNLIDTPGHVDFGYEVSRSLYACEGVLLVVDAAQGVEAQTLANVYQAIEHDLEIIPVINKVDLPSADPDGVIDQIESHIGLDAHGAARISAKTGLGCEAVLDAVVTRIPPPPADRTSPLRALIFDSTFDSYRGVIVYVRVKEGEIRPGDRIRFMASGSDWLVDEVGHFGPKMTPDATLGAGEVGYIIAGVKDIRAVKIGDTVTHAKRPAAEPLPGFREAQPMVFAGFYPVNSDDYDDLKSAIEKLQLNDASFHVEAESSTALGFGFRCGFLGLLHMEIIRERLEREYDTEILVTAPSVPYRVVLTDGTELMIDNPSKLPDVSKIDHIEEPFIEAHVIAPPQYLGGLLTLLEGRHGVQKKMEYIATTRVLLTYELPMSQIITDFYDKLKSVSSGYASFDYQLIGYRPDPLVKLDILINGQPVDALSVIVLRADAERRGRQLAQRLRKIVPRQLFEVAIQAAIGSKIIARETVKAMRKDVLAKCYGGDITRKRKLLEKQKEGKKRMKSIGRVDIPQEAFMAVLSIGEDE
ncbi:MAG: elongation factor 4 [Candidatus Sumerlaeia bacterium]|nr:elongation factor 4 [Candidatus Sumerlaeia bacterium]